MSEKIIKKGTNTITNLFKEMNIFSVKKDEKKKRINKNNKINTVFLLIKKMFLY